MMLRKCVAAAKYVLELAPPGPDLRVYRDDVFLISYPKSGNTWTRFLVGNLVSEDRAVDFLSIPEIIPHIDVMPKRFFESMPRPRIINCHEPFDPRYKRVIYVVRDPRDVAVSLYHFQRKRRTIDDSYPMEQFLTRFLAGDNVFPPRMGSWAQNVASWIAARQNTSGFLLLRYEDLLADAEGELAKVACLLGIKITPQRLARAVESSSAGSMRDLEKCQGERWHQSKGTRTDIPFVRSASAGGWRSILSPACVAQMESVWGDIMTRLGYELSAAASPQASVDIGDGPSRLGAPHPLRRALSSLSS